MDSDLLLHPLHRVTPSTDPDPPGSAAAIRRSHRHHGGRGAAVPDRQRDRAVSQPRVLVDDVGDESTVHPPSDHRTADLQGQVVGRAVLPGERAAGQLGLTVPALHQPDPVAADQLEEVAAFQPLHAGGETHGVGQVRRHVRRDPVVTPLAGALDELSQTGVLDQPVRLVGVVESIDGVDPGSLPHRAAACRTGEGDRRFTRPAQPIQQHLAARGLGVHRDTDERHRLPIEVGHGPRQLDARARRHGCGGARQPLQLVAAIARVRRHDQQPSDDRCGLRRHLDHGPHQSGPGTGSATPSSRSPACPGPPAG